MPATASARPARHRLSGDFWKYWAGQTISNLGTSFTQFALPLLIYKLTGSALNLGITSAATFLPYLFFGLIIGAWVDRVNRKRLMILVDIGRALFLTSIPLLAAIRHLSVWWIYAVAFVNSTLAICFDSSEFAAIPSLVDQDDLVTANGRIQASYSAAGVVGPLAAGVLVAVLPIPLLLLVDAASFLVSALSLALVRISFNVTPSERRAPASLRRDVVEGLRYVLGHPVLRNISAMMALVNFIGVTYFAQLVLFGKQRLHASNPELGLLYAAGSVGVVVLGLVAGTLRRRWSFSTVALGALMLEGLLTIALALTPWFWVALPIAALIGGLGILFNINTSSLRQAIVPNHLLGRVVSIASVLAWSAIPLGSLLGGFAIEATHNVVLVYAMIGVLTLLIPFAFSFTALGHAERYLPRAASARESEQAVRAR
jgi:MFS family permease